MFDLSIKENTFFKLRPVQSEILGDAAKHFVKNGSKFKISSYNKIDNHFRVVFDGLNFEGACCWYVYEYHIEIFEGEQKLYPLPQRFQISDFPYHTQLNNLNNPTGSCNVTSIAMCLAYFGVTAPTGQLEDELYNYA